MLAVGTGMIRRERRSIVRSCDCDRHRRGRTAAVIVGDGDTVSNLQRLADGEEVEAAVSRAVGEADRARPRIGTVGLGQCQGSRGRESVGLGCGQASAGPYIGWRTLTDRVGVAEIDLSLIHISEPTRQAE